MYPKPRARYSIVLSEIPSLFNGVRQVEAPFIAAQKLSAYKYSGFLDSAAVSMSSFATPT